MGKLEMHVLRVGISGIRSGRSDVANNQSGARARAFQLAATNAFWARAFEYYDSPRWLLSIPPCLEVEVSKACSRMLCKNHRRCRR